MAIAEAQLAAHYNRPASRSSTIRPTDSSAMATSWRACLGSGFACRAPQLGKLILLYDDNRVTLASGTDSRSRRTGHAASMPTDGTPSMTEGNDLSRSIGRSMPRVRSGRPSLILVRTHLGLVRHTSTTASRLTARRWGSTKWPHQGEAGLAVEPLVSHSRARARAFREALGRGELAESEWHDDFSGYELAFPNLAERLSVRYSRGFTDRSWDADIPVSPQTSKASRRAHASGKVMNAVAHRLPSLMGGSADLTHRRTPRLRASATSTRHRR